MRFLTDTGRFLRWIRSTPFGKCVAPPSMRVASTESAAFLRQWNGLPPLRFASSELLGLVQTLGTMNSQRDKDLGLILRESTKRGPIRAGLFPAWTTGKGQPPSSWATLAVYLRSLLVEGCALDVHDGNAAVRKFLESIQCPCPWMKSAATFSRALSTEVRRRVPKTTR
jgi:hypothetical protein